MTTDLKAIAALAESLFDAEAKVVELSAGLKEAQRAAQKIKEHDLPEAMEDVGLTNLTTSSGLIVKVDNKLHAKALSQAHTKALEWLREKSQAGLIKTTVGVPFSAGSEADADELLERLSGEGIAAAKTCSVHPSSLSAALRRMLEEGEEIPDFMGAYQVTAATVTAAKKAKK